MRLKEGVRIAGLQPEMVIAAAIIETVYKKYNVEFVITSGVEGKHSKTSRHYLGFAIDTRTRDFLTNDLAKVQREIQRALGDDFYIQFEGNHFHIQFSPKQLVG